MKVVIIEDEPLTSEDLTSALLEVDPSIEVVAQLDSVMEAIEYFNNHELPDLIFSDIQLGDGLSFELFKKVDISTPVIFCTAFDEYAIQAFKANGIDYIMKPFSRQMVAEALSKYDQFKSRFTTKDVSFESVLDLLTREAKTKQASILVYHKDQIIPIRTQDIALFYLHNEVVHLKTFKGKDYLLDNNLDKIDEITGNDFFRVNRQNLVNRQAIEAASRFFARKLTVSLKIDHHELIIVSKAKAPSFLRWMSN